jgi:hypothetical protein
MRITDIPTKCGQCGWAGTIYDCEPDDDGCLTCPDCSERIIIVSDIFETGEHHASQEMESVSDC